MGKKGIVFASELTEFGRYLDNILHESGNILTRDTMPVMADKLGFQLVYLSDIRRGKEWIPNDFIEKLIICYPLARKRKDMLMAAAQRSNQALQNKK